MKPKTALLKNPGQLSNLNFHQADADFISKPEGHLVVRTPSRPNFFWGNYICFPHPPTENDFENWMSHYKTEFNVNEQGYITMTWDSSEPGKLDAFTDFGFTIEEQLVLKLGQLKVPEKFNQNMEVRLIQTESDWSQLKETQWITNWPLIQSQHDFLANKIATYRRLQDRGFGQRIGAFENDVLVADLGIYWLDGIGRFNNICTHADHYNKGICRTLVYEASKWALSQPQMNQLIIEATQNEYAFKIYQKCGYEIIGKDFNLTWMSEKWKT